MIAILIITAHGQGVWGGPISVAWTAPAWNRFKLCCLFFLFGMLSVLVCLCGFLRVSAYFSGAHVDPPNVTPYVFLP